MRYFFSFFFWYGSITVENGAVTDWETIDFNIIDEPPELLTIDGWFDKISDALARNAASIDVGWHPDHGFPLTGFIDLSLLIADEEQSWRVERFEVLR